jgi:hypothetical protein
VHAILYLSVEAAGRSGTSNTIIKMHLRSVLGTFCSDLIPCEINMLPSCPRLYNPLPSYYPLLHPNPNTSPPIPSPLISPLTPSQSCRRSTMHLPPTLDSSILASQSYRRSSYRASGETNTTEPNAMEKPSTPPRPRTPIRPHKRRRTLVRVLLVLVLCVLVVAGLERAWKCGGYVSHVSRLLFLKRERERADADVREIGNVWIGSREQTRTWTWIQVGRMDM